MLGKIEGRKRRGRQRLRWLGSITDSLSGHEFEQTLEIVEERGGWCAAVYVVTNKLDTT